MKTLEEYLQAAGCTNVPKKLRGIKMLHSPWEHQLGDLQHLLDNFRSAIWNDAGTGKTLPMQAISMIYAALGNKVIAVMPPVLIEQWQESLREEYIGSDTVFDIQIFSGTPAKRKKLLAEWQEKGNAPDILLMSYEKFRDLHPAKNKQKKLANGDVKVIKKLRYHPLRTLGFDLLVFDEAHKLKNASSSVHKTVKKYLKDNEDCCIKLFTGSPIPNTLSDAYGMISLIDPEAYPTKRRFEHLHCEFNPYSDFREIIGYKNTELLYENLYKYGRRVTKQEALADLPECLPSQTKLKLYPEHKKLYTDLLRTRIMEIDGDMIDATHDSKFRQLALQLVSCPSMFTDKPVKSVLEEWLANLLENINLKEHKVVVFCYFQMTVEFLAEKYAEYNPATIYGKTKDAEAERKKFVNDDDCRLAILNIDSGGVGLNLQVSHYIIFYENPITPHQANQGLARCHRGGQKEIVRAYFPRVVGTIAAKRLTNLLSKEALNNAVVRDKHKLLKELLGSD